MEEAKNIAKICKLYSKDILKISQGHAKDMTKIGQKNQRYNFMTDIYTDTLSKEL